jgi:hypothetical protein
MRSIVYATLIDVKPVIQNGEVDINKTDAANTLEPIFRLE